MTGLLQDVRYALRQLRVGVCGVVVQGNEIASPVRPEVAVSFQQLPASSTLTHLVAVATSFAMRSNRCLD